MHPRQTSLLLLALGLQGCKSCHDTPTSDAPETFANPPELQPDANGTYQLHLTPGEVEIEGKRYCLRTYNGAIPGPTLRFAAGENRREHVKLSNDFQQEDWREVSGMEGREEPSCHDFNLTNLHFHGGHVQPNYATTDGTDPCEGEGCGPYGQYYGDNVLIEVAEGGTAQYRWDLDEDGTHHEGTDWYHPHIHGSTAIQVINGAAGALIVGGPLDAEASVAATRERVMMINEIPYNHGYTRPLEDGENCDEAHLSINNFLSVTEGMPILVNGKVAPRLVTAAGQVERWRMIYAGTPDEMGMKLHPSTSNDCSHYNNLVNLEFDQYARDGITMPQYYKSDTVWVSPGYRVDSFVKMPDTPQTLCLVGTRTHDLTGSVIAIVDVREGTPTTTTVPDEKVVSSFAPPTTWTSTVHGETKEVSCDTMNSVDQRVGLLMPPMVEMGGGQMSDGGSCEPSDTMGSTDGEVCECPSPNISCRNFESRRAWGYRSDRVAVANTSEQWEIVAFDGHPYHIHINPFLVCPNNSNKEPNFAHWRDTMWVQVDDGPRKILMNFKTFTGTFVEHCHKLNHEDEGMMEKMEICAADDLDCQCLGYDEVGQCISQGGCKEDDLQCKYAAEVTAAYPLPPPDDPELCGN